MAKRAQLSLDKSNGHFQISLSVLGDDNLGHGYRLMGPKYIGNSVAVKEVDLSQRDADEIRAILDEVFPPAPALDTRPVRLASEPGDELQIKSDEETTDRAQALSITDQMIRICAVQAVSLCRDAEELTVNEFMATVERVAGYIRDGKVGE